MPGFDSVEWLIVDDGSRDSTVQVARAHGVDHVVSLRQNRGLARAFAAGGDACVRLGADVIVNTEADAQYDAADIPALVAPLLAGHADIVIVDRQPGTLAHFSPVKRVLQGLGSRVVRWLSATNVPDAISGFRAFTREAALRINVVTEFSYTLESIIQAGHIRMSIAHIPIRARETKRQSRLFRSMPAYILHSLRTLASVVLMYRPLRVFAAFALAFATVGVGVGGRFLYFFASGDGAGPSRPPT